MSAATGIRSVISLGLIGHALYQMQHDANWWLYVPAYSLAGIVCLIPLPNSVSWRVASAVSTVGGGLLMLFLAWTLTGLEGTVGLELTEGKSLLPIAAGVALTTSLRLTSDRTSSPLQYLRSFIILTLLIASLICFALGTRYI